MGEDIRALSSANATHEEVAWTLPTGAIAQTTPRVAATSDQSLLSTGRLTLAAVYLRAGQVVANISFLSGTTPLATGSNQWFSLWSSARVLRGVTADDTSTAWAANTLKTLAMVSPYTITTTGIHYLGILVVASTVPTLRSVSLGSAVSGLAPIITGTSDTGLTNPASAPGTAAAITAVGNVPYAYAS